MSDDNGIVLSDEQKRRRRNRNLAIAAVLVGLVVLFYLITLFKLGANVLDRTL